MSAEIEKARVGRVVVEKVAGKWLVYELGPMTVHDSYLEAVKFAEKLDVPKATFEDSEAPTRKRKTR